MTVDPAVNDAVTDKLAPSRRVVVLGASNVKRNISTVAAVARATACEPIDLMMALGHGRSYGKPSSVPGRRLPGILESQLWQDLAERPRLPTVALITDVGNDLLYGVSPERLLGWVGQTLERLLRVDAEVRITGLPIDSMRRLGRLRYGLFRTFMFPHCRLPLEQVQRYADEVHSGLEELANSKAQFVRLRSEWYGFDPIHFKRKHSFEAWQTLFAATFSKKSQKNFRLLNLSERVALQLATPAERTLFGVRQNGIQPATSLSDGTKVSLY